MAIYEVSNRAGILYGFEVIEIKIHPAQEILGRCYLEREGYPEFGILGFESMEIRCGSAKRSAQSF